MRTLVVVFAITVGCRGGPSQSSAGEIVGWRLVDRPAAEVDSDLGDATLAPTARVMLFEPVYANDEIGIVVTPPPARGIRGASVDLDVTITPAAAGPGDVVVAMARVRRANAACVYEVTAQPTREGVELLGPPSMVIVGAAAAQFRFTAHSQGAGGLVIRAWELR